MRGAKRREGTCQQIYLSITRGEHMLMNSMPHVVDCMFEGKEEDKRVRGGDSDMLGGNTGQ